MKKFHISIATDDIEKSVKDYSSRLGKQPDSMLAGEYAFWRTESLNFSVRHDTKKAVGALRHLGWEDSESTEFTSDTDINGIIWESFSAEQQLEEVRALWLEAE